MPQQKRRIKLSSGKEVKVRIAERLDKHTVRLDVLDGARYRIDADDDGSYDVVGTWDENNNLADLPIPDWLDEVVAQLT